MKKIHFTPIMVFFISFFMWTSISQPALTSQADDETCEAKPFDNLEIAAEAGNLIYQANGVVSSTSGRFNVNRRHFSNAGISPNGEFIAASTAEGGRPEWTEVYNHAGEFLYAGAPSNASIVEVRWLGNEKLMSFFIRLTNRDPLSIVGGTDFDFGYFLIDPFTRSYTYVLPPHKPPFYLEDSNTSIIEAGYEFTYDGRYIYTYNGTVYDFETEQSLVLENFRWGLPATLSNRVIGVEWNTEGEQKKYSIYIYNFDIDSLIQPTIFTPEAEISGSYENSWSPDETLWGYALAHPSEDLTSFRRVELLQLASGDITKTCLGLFYKIEGSTNLQYTNGGYSPQFAWSRDSRYLALTAVLEDHEMDESFGIYLYDTHTGDIYEVYRGNATIIGWMANQDN